LFLDRLPLHSWVYHTPSQSVRLWSVSLPVLPAAPGPQAPPSGLPPQRWLLDTACTGEGLAWRPHLQSAGLNPAIRRASPIRIRTAGGQLQQVPVRKAALWLFSNIPALSKQPFRLALSPGIPFVDRDFSGDPELYSPVIGLQALLRAGLRVQIDFAKQMLSVWTPGPWPQSFSLALRRVLSGYSTVPMPWSRPRS
jgi:hypothetical protein